ncbi:MAG: MBL fold metallo-hydrolase [Bernardetiaceae bacterium]|nr:MBL fold metallo-hydrolase [Bernardetiaceae bacterium]
MLKIIDLHFLDNQDTIASFLIESQDGLILVESGPYSTFKHLSNAIQKAGFAVEDVRHVLLTHIHFDHAGAAWAFAEKGAQIYVHPFGAGHLAEPDKLTESARRIYKDDMDRLWGDMRSIPKTQIQAIDHEQIIKIANVSFCAWHTPGHANHHIAWQLDDILFTGDVAGVRIGGEDGIIMPPCPPPDIDLAKWKHSIKIMKDINPSALYLTHFGKYTDVKAHLEELEANLHVHADFIKKLLELGEDTDTMVTLFEDFISEALQRARYSKDRMAQYQAANPAFMGVAGLTRYWKKQGLEF